MKAETKQKKIHYKRAVIEGGTSSLQDLLLSALHFNKPEAVASNRREVINQEDNSCRLINGHTIYNGVFFGQLVFFESGKSQTFISLDDTAKSYSLGSLTSDLLKNVTTEKEAESLKQEFVDSILYFGVLDNHVVLLQSSALRARELETHLAWFLGTCTSSIPATSVFVLKDKPSEHTFQKIERNPVRSVKIGAPVGSIEDTANLAQPSTPVLSEHKPVEAKSLRWVPKGMGVDVVRALLGAGFFDNMKLEDALDDSNLKVSLEITYLRKTTSNGQKMLDQIATSLRHMDDNDVRIELQGGGTLQGNDLRLSGPISVKTVNGLVDESDLYHQMHAWLVSKIQSDEIEVEGGDE